jgi:hypothetical protein
MKMHWARGAAPQALLWGFTALTVLSMFGWPMGEFDDAITLVQGTLIQQGQTPNLDFYSFYPPLSLYLNAGIFSILGRSIIAVRIAPAVMYGVFLLVAMRFYKRRFPNAGGLVPLAVLLVAAAVGSAIAAPPWVGLSLSLIALLMYLDSQDRPAYIAMAGLLTGVAVLFRVNFGGYVAAVIAIDIALRWWLSGRERWKRGPLRSALSTAAIFAVPLAASCLCIGLSIYGRNAGHAVAEFVFNTQRIMLHARFLNLGYSAEVACAVAFPPAWFFFRILRGADKVPGKALLAAALAAFNFLLALAASHHPWVGAAVLGMELASVLFLHIYVYRLDRSEFALLLHFCFMIHYYLARADAPHWRPLPMGAMLLLPFLIFQKREAQRDVEAPKGTALAILAALIFLFLASPDYKPVVSFARNGVKLLGNLIADPHKSDSDRLFGQEAAIAGIYHDRDELDTLRYLRGRTTSRDPIFVGLKDHSRTYVSNLRMYWLADRPIGVRRFQLETRITTEPDVQEQMISDLERNNVQWVVLDCVPALGDETFLERGYVGSNLLDNYIQAHYREEARFGRYAVLSGSAIGGRP